MSNCCFTIPPVKGPQGPRGPPFEPSDSYLYAWNQSDAPPTYDPYPLTLFRTVGDQNVIIPITILDSMITMLSHTWVLSVHFRIDETLPLQENQQSYFTYLPTPHSHGSELTQDLPIGTALINYGPSGNIKTVLTETTLETKSSNYHGKSVAVAVFRMPGNLNNSTNQFGLHDPIVETLEIGNTIRFHFVYTVGINKQNMRSTRSLHELRC